MRKKLRTLASVALALMLALILSVGVFAADAIPLEYVSFGYGMPEEAGVAMHELTAENITLEGVSYDVRTENGTLYIRLADLASAKLLREKKEDAAKAGLDYAKLCIKKGAILVKDNVPEAEREAVQAKLDSLKAGVVVAVNVGDVFDLGNAGTLKLQVKIANLYYAPQAASGNSSSGSRPKPDPMPDPDEKKGLDIIVVDEESRGTYYDDSAFKSDSIEVTTVFIDIDDGMSYKVQDDDKPPKIEVDLPIIGIAYADDDTNTYYIKIIGTKGAQSEFVEAPHLEENSKENSKGKFVEGFFEDDEDDLDGPKEPAKTVIIATDKDGNNVVQTINLDYKQGDLLRWYNFGDVLNDVGSLKEGKSLPENYRYIIDEKNKELLFDWIPPRVKNENGKANVEIWGNLRIKPLK